MPAKNFAKWILWALLISCTSAAQQLNNRLTNQDVIDMVSLGLSDEVIIQKVRSGPVNNFDTSIPRLRELKAAKVSDAVITWMINPSLVGDNTVRHVTPIDNAADRGGLPEEVGVYLMRHGSLTEVQPEIVNWQTGGVLKSSVTLGLVKGDKNGKVMRRNSRTQASMPSEFVIKTVEGTSVEEYQLLRLHTKTNRREFRSVTGGILHLSGGAQRDEVSFQPVKIGSRTWKIVLPNLPRGEYGFLPPGVASASLSASGKMYTFGIEDSPQKEAAWTESGGVAEAMSLKPEASRLQNASSGTIGASYDGNPTTRHDGITLTNVVRDGPSAQAGIKPGDVVLAIDDRYLYTAQEMNDEIHHRKPGDRIVVRYRHYTSVYEASLVLATAQ